ncbi:KxYKxGKxW signal peptide domain-containing protein, partial [Listeria innocua]|uniref:Ig-like domain-containing protein n=1 Tax=Listeria innocua TaxID=1642 RepID=UPI0016250705
MRFTRKAREQKQKNWRMWKKGKQWLCGAALFFTVVSSPGMLVLADEVNDGNSTAITAGEVETPLPEEATENEVEEVTEEDETSSTEAVAPSQQEENTLSTAANNETKAVEGKKERPKQGRIITQPTAISDIFPDAKLAAEIVANLNSVGLSVTSSSLVTQSDLDLLTYVHLYGELGDGNAILEQESSIDFSGIEHLRNLGFLGIDEYGVSGGWSEITTLPNLIELQFIDCWNIEEQDLSQLTNLPSLTKLGIYNTYEELMGLSDVSQLATLTNLTELVLYDNQIKDISPLAVLTNTKIYAMNQKIIETIKWTPSVERPNEIKGITGLLETPSSISNGGEYQDTTIKWEGLLNEEQEVSYAWQDIQVSKSDIFFSGNVTVRIEPANVKIMVDSDGNSQTTGDQTLFAEETSNLDTLEDMYNFAKEQLNGTDYGLLSIAPNSDGDYVILVSRVGSLKKEDASGTAVGTDVPYTPTYTVTGTGNTAQLEVSYGVTVDAPPTGYVYIYGKGTAQEARSTASTSITIPLTDTNGNGTPQWQEDYTVKQYKKAGALHPSIPGGDQEVIGGVPDDAVGGDIVTIPPDTITGSDGREYIVDPSIDIDP